MKVVKYVVTFIILFASISSAADYYVDNRTGNDAASGNSPAKAWRTIAKINRCNFSPGDTIHLKRGEVWEEELIISARGRKTNPIRYTTYGNGANPVLKRSNTFSNWTLHASFDSVKVWRGSIKGVRNSFGAVVSGVRVPKYFEYKEKDSEWSAPDSTLTMNEGFFFAPLNSGKFYFRSDHEKPAKMEIGARKYAIQIENSSHVVIDGIDACGPSGRTDRGSETGLGLIVINASHYIAIKNATLCHSGVIVFVQNSSSHCCLDNLTIYDSRSTAVFLTEAGPGNRIQNSRIFGCGNLITDFGDMAGIGIWKTQEVTIEGCEVYGNGHPGLKSIDALISFVESPQGVVKSCLLRNAGGTAIQFAENSDYGLAAYNIIDKWGVYGSKGHNEGIRVGGGKGDSTAKACKIYNNLLINGGTTAGKWAALRLLNYQNDGLEVINNIFYNNKGIYEILAESKNGFNEWRFSNNIFYRTEGDAIIWAGKIYDYQHIIGQARGYYSFDQNQEKQSVLGDPRLSSDFKGLASDSPCIGSGINVGLLQDYFGNQIPADEKVNIGPFQKTGR